MKAARLGPGVINLSFGGEQDDALLRQAVDLAFRRGSLVVASVGNRIGFCAAKAATSTSYACAR